MLTVGYHARRRWRVLAVGNRGGAWPTCWRHSTRIRTPGYRGRETCTRQPAGRPRAEVADASDTHSRRIGFGHDDPWRDRRGLHVRAAFGHPLVYWLATDPPFTRFRPPLERLAALRGRLPAAGGWVLSGSAVSSAKPIEPLYDLIVFLRLDPSIRMDRLRRRERARYGQRIEPGGDMAAAGPAAFLAWASAYDTAGMEQRSHIAHTEWLAAQAAPVLELDSSEPVELLARAVLSAAARQE